MNQNNSLWDDAIAIWRAGVNAVNAEKLVTDAVSVLGDQLQIASQKFPVENIERIICVGFGKASGAMALGLEQVLAELPAISLTGLVNVPDDQVVSTSQIQVVGCRPSGENLPTAVVLESTRQILQLVRSAGPNDLVVCLISGGGSALLELPLDSGTALPIRLDDIRNTTRFLSASGASIQELNAVRRSISQVKGGSLAAASGGAPVIALIISDVVGDHLDVIASGPTAESSNKLHPLSVLEKYDPDRTEVASSVWQVIESKLKPEVKFPQKLRVHNSIIGNVQQAMQAAQVKAIKLGYDCRLDQPNGNEGDAEFVGRGVVKQILEMGNLREQRCLIQGGETTVDLCDHPGQGGRNQHLVLAALDELINSDQEPDGEFCLLSGGTDAEDGTVPVAGAIIDNKTVAQFRERLSDETHVALAQCNSFEFHQAHSTLLITPKTWTNVCDLRVILTSNPIEKTTRK